MASEKEGQRGRRHGCIVWSDEHFSTQPRSGPFRRPPKPHLTPFFSTTCIHPIPCTSRPSATHSHHCKRTLDAPPSRCATWTTWGEACCSPTRLSSRFHTSPTSVAALFSMRFVPMLSCCSTSGSSLCYLALREPPLSQVHVPGRDRQALSDKALPCLELRLPLGCRPRSSATSTCAYGLARHATLSRRLLSLASLHQPPGLGGECS